MSLKRVFARILLFPLVLLAVVVTLTLAHLVVEAASLTAPTSLAASAVSNSRLKLTWVDTTKSETAFEVERSLSATSGFALIGRTGKNVNNYWDSTVGSGTTYYYRVRATGRRKATSPYSNVASATTPTTAPTVSVTTPTTAPTLSTSSSPLTLGGTASDDVSVMSVAWSNATTGGGGPASGTTSWSASVPLKAGSNLISVTAKDAANNAGTDTITVTYTPPDTTAPSVPTLTATAASCNQINLSWTASTDNAGGSGLKGYNVYRGGAFLKQVLAPATSTSDSGLAPSAAYSYAVSAVDNANNESAKSNTAITNTTACADTTAPIVVSHKDGTITPYSVATDSDIARGTALLNAMAAALDGDVIQLSANTFDVQVNQIDLSLGGTGTVHLKGAGKYVTIIKSALSSQLGTRASVHPGNNSITADLSIIGTVVPGPQWVWGALTDDTSFTNAELINVYIQASIDGIYINQDNCSAIIRNVTIHSTWDTIYISSLNSTFDIYDSEFVGVADPAIYSGEKTGGITLGGSSTLNSFRNTISATGGTLQNRGYRATAKYNQATRQWQGGTVNIYGGSITTSGGGTPELFTLADLFAEYGSTINVTADTIYDPAKAVQSNGGVINVVGP